LEQHKKYNDHDYHYYLRYTCLSPQAKHILFKSLP